MSDQRILIREHTIEDLEPYCDWQSDPEVGRHVSWLPRMRSEAEASLRDAIAQQHATPRVRYFFAVVLDDSGEMVGDVGFTLRSASVADCGWFIRKSFWGNGYGPAAVQRMVPLAFGIPGVEELSASCNAQNASSIRVMEKCGFSLIRASDHRRTRVDDDTPIEALSPQTGHVLGAARAAAQQAVAADAQQLAPIDSWYRSGGGRLASALAVSAVGRS